MFGSDYPSLPLDRLLREWDELGFSAEIMDKVFHANAERVLRLPAPAARAGSGADGGASGQGGTDRGGTDKGGPDKGSPAGDRADRASAVKDRSGERR
jgi:hypothetical protein